MKSLTRSLLNRLRTLLGRALRFLARQRKSRFLHLIRHSSLESLRRVSKPTIARAAIFAIAAALVLAVWSYPVEPSQTFYVAYVGRYYRPAFDEFHVRALKKYVREMNQELHGVQIEILEFCNNQSEDGSRSVYEQISKNPKIVAVVDNTWGKELQSVASQIAEKQIPVISINADKGDKQFNNAAVFISYDDDIPNKVTAFARTILNVKEPIFVGELDYKLSAVFLTKLRNSSMNVSVLYVRDSKGGTAWEQQQLYQDLDSQIEQWRRLHDGSPAVIVNTHGIWGVKIIEHLDAYHRDVTILGGPFIIDWASYHHAFGRNQNRNRLIIFTYPHDSVINKIHNDLREIKVSGVELGKPNELLYVKRCLDAVSIVRGALMDELIWSDKPTVSRDGFIDFFRERLADNRYAGKHDLYVFDKDLRLADERTFEEYFQGRTFSYDQQLTSEDKPMPTIYAKFDKIKYTQIDEDHKRTFHAEFLCALSSDQPDIEKYTIHFLNAIRIQIEPLSSLTPEGQTNEGSSEKTLQRQIRTLRVSGDFTMKPDFKKYPIDHQELPIEMTVISPQGNSPRISFELSGFEDDSSDAWYREEFYATKDNDLGLSSLGTPNIENNKPHKYQTLTLRLLVSRRSEFVRVLLPLFFIALLAIGLLYIHDSNFATEGQICVAILASLIAYSVTLAQSMPRSNVPTIADKVVYCTFVTVLAVFLKISFYYSRLITTVLKKWINQHSIMLGNLTLAGYFVAIGLLLLLA